MIIEEYKKDKTRTRYIRAADQKALFKHCANGKCEVTKSEYTKEVEPMLWMHGVGMIETKDCT